MTGLEFGSALVQIDHAGAGNVERLALLHENHRPQVLTLPFMGQAQGRNQLTAAGALRIHLADDAKAADQRGMAHSMAGVFSTARRNRHQYESGIEFATRGVIWHRSSTTTPNPPAWINKSAAFNACSTFFPQRIQTSWDKTTPQAAALAGSKES